MAEPSIPPGFDFTDPDLYLHRVPAEELAELSRTAPVWWNAQPRGASGFDDEGYWVVTKHADVLEVSRGTATSTPASRTPRSSGTAAGHRRGAGHAAAHPAQHRPAAHTKLRGIVSRGFTPRAIRNLREALTGRAERDCRGALPTARVTSSPTWPANCRCRPSPSCSGSRRRTGARSSTGRTRWSATTTRSMTGTRTAAAAELVGYSMADGRGPPRLPARRHRHQAGARRGGRRPPVPGRVRLLHDPAAVPGNETTRNAISHGMLALLDHPEQWELYKEQRPETAGTRSSAGPRR